jgi:hypothetical protein
MGTERYDELKLAQSCFASFQQFMARIQREKKIGAQKAPRHIVEGAMLATLPVQEEKLDRAYGRAIGLNRKAFLLVRARRDDQNSFCRSINVFEKKERGLSKNLRPSKDHAYEFCPVTISHRLTKLTLAVRQEIEAMAIHCSSPWSHSKPR